MDKAKKQRIKRYITFISLVALVAALAFMPLVASSEQQSEGPDASILSGTVENGSISTGIHGGGILQTQEAEDVIIPSGVKITEFLVNNRDTVKAGDPVASVDRVSVMTTITAVQETMDYLIGEMADATDGSASTKVTAEAGGLVKVIYAQEGDSVQDVMLEHGALAVLSLDGLMAAQIQRNTDLTTGDSVLVYLDDETQITGRVDSNMNGVLEVTVEDDGYEIDTRVLITTEDGQRLGSAELYVHNAWNAVAYTGTVSKVNASVNKTLQSGATLLTLKDTDFNAQLEALLSQYNDYEDLMLDLFQMYQSATVYAPCDGVVSGVDQDSIHLLSAADGSYTLSLLANAPNGNDDVSYVNFVGMVTGISDLGAWNLAMNPNEISIVDYLDLSVVDRSEAGMTAVGTHVPTKPIYEYVNGGWVQLSANEISVGDKLIFAHSDDSGEPVWVVRIEKAVADDTQTPVDPTVPPESVDPSAPLDPSSPEEIPSESIPSESPSDSNLSGDMENMSGMGSMGGMGSYFGGTTQESSFTLFDLEGSVLLSVTPQESVTLSISVDEHQISKITLGMEAQVAVNALKNETFTAKVTDIGNSGTSSGGYSKFTVELTMDYQSQMLNGMTALATIPMESQKDIPVIPVAAIVEIGSKSYVYTGYSESDGTMTGLTEVTLGISDGTSVQILSGLETGDSYWYAYYDTLELDHNAESSNGFSSMFG